MHVDWKLTLDGIMTLLAGVLAFVAVQLQIRDQRKGQDLDRERRTRAVAKALLFEIDNFYRAYLRDPRKVFEKFDMAKGKLPGVRPIGENPFPVYLANASGVGELEVDNVQAIVGFYGAALSYVSIWQDYKTSLARADEIEGLLRPPGMEGVLAATQAQYEASQALEHIKGAIPELIRLTWLVCHNLCKFTGTDFKYAVVGAAAENISLRTSYRRRRNGWRERELKRLLDSDAQAH